MTILSATGLYHPPHKITNAELVQSFNQYVDQANSKNDQGPLLEHSSEEFIVKVSGIKERYVIEKEGILDPQRMCPAIKARDISQNSYQCEWALKAYEDLRLKNAPKNIDLIIMANSNFERPYPSLAIEVQNALGVKGMAFDMNVACSSAPFAIKVAHDMISQGTISNALIFNAEICSSHLNFRQRDGHFIFGDACTATLLESDQSFKGSSGFKIVSSKLETQYSRNIKNQMGCLNRSFGRSEYADENYFSQNGKMVFKEVTTRVCELTHEHLLSLDIPPTSIKRLWAHQANTHMNRLIAQKIFGKDVTPTRVPQILEEFANTSSAGSIICFHKHHSNLKMGDLGLLCAFGAGYSIGQILVEAI